MQLVGNPSSSYVHSPKESRQCYQSLERERERENLLSLTRASTMWMLLI